VLSGHFFLSVANRVIVVVAGVGLGLLTIMPNLMMATTPPGAIAAQIGITASISLGLGGIASAVIYYEHPFLGVATPYLFLLPGVLIQSLAFLVAFRHEFFPSTINGKKGKIEI
jgi:hypothetical protein